MFGAFFALNEVEGSEACQSGASTCPQAPRDRVPHLREAKVGLQDFPEDISYPRTVESVILSEAAKPRSRKDLRFARAARSYVCPKIIAHYETAVVTPRFSALAIISSVIEKSLAAASYAR